MSRHTPSPSSERPSDHPPHPDGPFFVEQDLIWHGGIDHDGVSSYQLLGVRGGRLNLPMALFSAEESVDPYEDPIPKDTGDDWWLLAAVGFTGIDSGSFGSPLDLLGAARSLLQELREARPDDLRKAGHDPSDPKKLEDLVVNLRWESMRRYLSLDPRLVWALTARNAAWCSADPPREPSPQERFERLLLAELIGQELEERKVEGLTDQAEDLAARAIADAAMPIWRRFCSDPENRSELDLRRYGGTVSLFPALLHLQFMEEERQWMDQPVPEGQSPEPLQELLGLGLRAAGLEQAAEDREVIRGLSERIGNAILMVHEVTYRPPKPELYFECFGISERRFNRLMQRAVKLE